VLYEMAKSRAVLMIGDERVKTTQYCDQAQIESLKRTNPESVPRWALALEMLPTLTARQASVLKLGEPFMLGQPGWCHTVSELAKMLECSEQEVRDARSTAHSAIGMELQRRRLQRPAT